MIDEIKSLSFPYTAHRTSFTLLWLQKYKKWTDCILDTNSTLSLLPYRRNKSSDAVGLLSVRPSIMPIATPASSYNGEGLLPKACVWNILLVPLALEMVGINFWFWFLKQCASLKCAGESTGQCTDSIILSKFMFIRRQSDMILLRVNTGERRTTTRSSS